MFDKLREVKKLREMQNALAKERAEIEEGGVRVVINGKMEVEEVSIEEGLSKEEIEKNTKNSINQCLKKVQMEAARRMQEMGGF